MVLNTDTIIHRGGGQKRLQRETTTRQLTRPCVSPKNYARNRRVSVSVFFVFLLFVFSLFSLTLGVCRSVCVCVSVCREDAAHNALHTWHQIYLARRSDRRRRRTVSMTFAAEDVEAAARATVQYTLALVRCGRHGQRGRSAGARFREEGL